MAHGRALRVLVLLIAVAGPAAGAPSDVAALPAAPADSSLRLAWQIALDREGFSPGLIDGNPGKKTAMATAEFQRSRGLTATGTLDDATAASLGVNPAAALASYTVTASDLEQVGSVPRSWSAKSRLSRLGYESLDWVLAEKFHCTRALLASLNRAKTIGSLKPGDTITVPATGQPNMRQADRLEISLGEKAIRAYSGQTCVGLFHCSIAASPSKRPIGATRVAWITENPSYMFDPAMYPEAREKSKLLIPPGPRNPVGLCWIGLARSGYGIHGTPNPELIGKTGSHGCFRLANWDAIRLGRMLRAGAAVQVNP
jgi:lipoprotein-anchoring transpeptidase ErfK/SrfK